MIPELSVWKKPISVMWYRKTWKNRQIFLLLMYLLFPLQRYLLPVRNLLTEEGEIVCLIKPQFEAGREKVGKKGVVRDPAVHLEVIEKVMDYAMSIALEPEHLSFSPIKGPEGNIEYLLHLQKKPEGAEVQSCLSKDPETVVKEAHQQLD